METKHYKETINGITYTVVFKENDFKDYYLNNKFHNESGPAIINYHLNGNVEAEYYYINDKCHNENGPAIIKYCPNGNIKYKFYYINDKQLYNINTNEELQQYLKYKNF